MDSNMDRICYSMSAPWRRKAQCSDLRQEATTMIAIGIVFSFIGLGYLCWLLFDLIVYALPVVVGVNAGMAAYHSGAGEIGAFIVGLVAGALSLVAGQIGRASCRERV